MLTRRRFLYTGAIAAAGVSVAGADGVVQSRHPELRKIEIQLSRLPQAFDGFTIAQLSDFHYEGKLSAVPIRKAVDVVNALSPDLIVLTGDFVTVSVFLYHHKGARLAAANAEPCAQILQELRAALGKFAILGNHDAASDPARVAGALKSHGIPVLWNRSLAIERGSARIWLAGVDDVLEGQSDLRAAIAKIPSGEVAILLAHEPDFADQVAQTAIDLQLSGHSHGGQIWLPGIGAPWLPPMGKRYPRGIYKVRNLTLYTNIGIGTIRAPVRLNCPPEVTLITLRASRS